MRSNLSKELWELTLKIRELMEEKGKYVALGIEARLAGPRGPAP